MSRRSMEPPTCVPMVAFLPRKLACIHPAQGGVTLVVSAEGDTPQSYDWGWKRLSPPRRLKIWRAPRAGTRGLSGLAPLLSRRSFSKDGRRALLSRLGGDNFFQPGAWGASPRARQSTVTPPNGGVDSRQSPLANRARWHQSLPPRIPRCPGRGLRRGHRSGFSPPAGR